MIYGNGLQSRVIAFKKDHPKHFRTGWRVMLPWLTLLLVSGLLLLLAQQLM